MDLNSKYDSLLQRITKNPNQTTATKEETLTNDREARLKVLYDASLDFKNLLANQRA